MFQEKPGVTSNIRIMSFISLFLAGFIAVYSLMLSRMDVNTITYVIIFVTGAFAPKVVQKFAENMPNKSTNVSQ